MIELARALVVDAGSCNAHSTPTPYRPDLTITRIVLRLGDVGGGIEIRLCDACAKELKAAL